MAQVALRAGSLRGSSDGPPLIDESVLVIPAHFDRLAFQAIYERVSVELISDLQVITVVRDVYRPHLTEDNTALDRFLKSAIKLTRTNKTIQ